MEVEIWRNPRGCAWLFYCVQYKQTQRNGCNYCKALKLGSLSHIKPNCAIVIRAGTEIKRPSPSTHISEHWWAEN